MAQRRRTIPLVPGEVELLKLLYMEYRYPSDQYERRPAALRRFVSQWNDLSERTDAPEEVMHYIITKRKARKWVRFDGDHEKMASMRDEFLTEQQWAALRAAYTDVLVSRRLGSDNIRFDPSLASDLSRRFRALSGKTMNASLLLAAIEAKRKRGEWITIGDRGIGFSDIEQVG
jgi:hypothetical protein